MTLRFGGETLARSHGIHSPDVIGEFTSGWTRMSTSTTGSPSALSRCGRGHRHLPVRRPQRTKSYRRLVGSMLALALSAPPRASAETLSDLATRVAVTPGQVHRPQGSPALQRVLAGHGAVHDHARAMHIRLESADESDVECTAMFNLWPLIRSVGWSGKAAARIYAGAWRAHEELGWLYVEN